MTNEIKRRTILKRASSTLLLLFLLCSCDGTLFHSFYSVNGEWKCDSVAEFTYCARYYPFATCGLRVEARTDAAYRYKNLVVRAEFLNTSDSLMMCDTIPIIVYNNNGHRIGATAGMLYQQASDIVSPNISFRDSVIIRLNHIMPENTLKGVHNIGIKLIRLD